MGSTANATQSELDGQEEFLNANGWQNAVRVPLPGDFSARHYVRLSALTRKALLMIMPKPEELAPFLSMQSALDQSGIRVPAVYAREDARGFALIEDLGDKDFGSLIRSGTRQDYLYAIALDALLTLHKSPLPKDVQLKQFTPQVFLEQVGLFFDGYSAAVLKRGFGTNAKTQFENAWRPALEKACAVPNAIMLRDYHAANIMFLEHEMKHKKAAMIDFQDGGIGPVTYDLASLLEDARLDVPPGLRAQMLEIYVGTSGVPDQSAFMSSYHILACQRHMRILAILAKRWVGGGYPETEDYFKRVWGLLMLHQSEPLLKPVYEWLDAYVSREFRQSWKPK